MKNKSIKYINHTVMECLLCGRRIISWSRNSYVPCSCGKCAIDGGFDYIKVTGDRKDFKLYNIKVPEYLKEGK